MMVGLAVPGGRERCSLVPDLDMALAFPSTIPRLRLELPDNCGWDITL